MTTRTINIALVEQEPQVRVLRFVPRLSSLGSDLLLETEYLCETEDDGNGSIDLPAGDNVRYDYEIPSNDGVSTGYFILPPGSPIALAVLIAAGGAATSSMIDAIQPDPETLEDAATIVWEFQGKESRIASVTLGGDRVLSIVGAASGASGVLQIFQDETGGRTITPPESSAVINEGAGVIDLTSTPGAEDIISFIKIGETYRWTIGLHYT